VDSRHPAASSVSTSDEFIHGIDDALAVVSKRLNALAQRAGCDRYDLQRMKDDRGASDDERRIEGWKRYLLCSRFDCFTSGITMRRR